MFYSENISVFFTYLPGTERERFVDFDCTVRELLVDLGYLQDYTDPKAAKLVVMIGGKQAYMEQRLSNGDSIVMFKAPAEAESQLPEDGGMTAMALAAMYTQVLAPSESDRAMLARSYRKTK